MQRVPLAPALRGCIASVWTGECDAARREHVVASGEMHLALRLDGPPLRLYAGRDDRRGHPVDTAVVCGARGGWYARRAEPGRSVGALLAPGGTWCLFGVPAAAIGERHLPLRSFWGDGVDALRRALAAAPTAAERLDRFEHALLARLRRPRPMPPRVAGAMAALEAGARVGEALAGAGCSHRHLAALFNAEVGLGPKRWARLRRFQRVLGGLDGDVDWAATALRHGYCDQAHLIGDFRAFAGVSPRDYLAARVQPRHVVVGP